MATRRDGIRLDVTGQVFYWRGPSPFHVVAVPEDAWAVIRDVAPMVSYGWGVIPVSARVGDTTFTTSLFPKEGGYLVPLKDAVRSAEGIDVDDTISVQLTIAARP